MMPSAQSSPVPDVNLCLFIVMFQYYCGIDNTRISIFQYCFSFVLIDILCFLLSIVDDWFHQLNIIDITFII